MSSKLNQARINGEPHNSFGFLSAAGVVNACDEFTKRQCLLLVINHQDMNIGQTAAQTLWGVSPICGFVKPNAFCTVEAQAAG
jgi:hypothetical protein